MNNYFIFICITILSFSLFVNADKTFSYKGHQYVLKSQQYTWANALAESLAANGYIAAFETYEEFVSVTAGLSISGDMTVWLGAKPIDSTLINWGWINGSTINQPFYIANELERCYKFCGAFGGNMRTNYLYFAASSPMKWLPATATDQRYVIIEIGGSNDPQLTQHDFGASFLFINRLNGIATKGNSTFSINDATGKMIGCKETSYWPTNDFFVCNLYTPLLDYDYSQPMNLTISTFGVEKLYQDLVIFNQPYATAIRQFNNQPNTITILGGNLLSIQNTTQCPFVFNGIQCSTYVIYRTDMSNVNSVIVQFSQSMIGKKLFPIEINLQEYNNYVYWSAPPILEQTTMQLYRYFPSLQFSKVNNWIQGTNVYKDYGYMGLVNNTALVNFFKVQLPSDVPKRIWQNIQYSDPGAKLTFQNQTYTNDFSNTTGSLTFSSIFYVDLENPSLVGLSPTDKSEIPSFAIYGTLPIQLPKDACNVGVTNGYYTFNTLSMGWIYATSTWYFNGQGPALPSTYTMSSQQISITNVPNMNFTTSRFTVNGIITNSDRTSMTRPFTGQCKYYAPYIDGSRTFFDPATLILNISGSYFANVLKVNGIAYYDIISMTNNNKLDLRVYVPPGQPLNFSITVGDTTSNTILSKNVTGVYPWIESITPNRFPIGNVLFTVTGQYFGGQTTAVDLRFGTANNNNQVPCTLTQWFNSSSFECSANSPSSTLYDTPLRIVTQSFKYNGNQEQPIIPNLGLTIGFYNIKVSNIVQNDLSVTVVGNAFDLYQNSLTFTVGNGNPDNVVCNATVCTFTLNSQCTMGQFTIQGLNSVYSTNVNWAPIVTTSQFNLGGSVTVQGTFVGSFTKVYLLPYLNQAQQIISLSNSGSFTPPNTYIGAQAPLKFTNDDTLFTKVFYGSYPAPQISSYNVGIDNVITIFGNYFGDKTNSPQATLAGLTVSDIPLTSYSSSIISFNIPNDARSGDIIITAGGQPTTKFRINIPATLLTVTKAPVVGGQVTITGKFIAPFSYGNVQVLQFKINDQVCENPTYTVSRDVVCTAPKGSGITQLSVSVPNNNTVVPYNISFAYQDPTVLGASSTVFGRPSTVTITGTNFASTNLLVSIGGKSCTSPSASSDGKTITCQFTSDVVSDTVLSVNVSVNGLSASFNGFIYSPPTNCPSSCGNGNCNQNTGLCNCFAGWIGSQCSFRLSSTDLSYLPAVNNKAESTLGYGFESPYYVNIQEIREIDENNNIITQVIMKDVALTQSGSTYTGTTGGATVTINTAVISSAQTINFYGNLFDAKSRSVKYNVNITNWSFKSDSNSLVVLFLYKTNSSSHCVNSEVVVAGATEDKTFARYFEINSAKAILQSYYADRYLLDGVMTNAKVIQMPSNDPSAPVSGKDTINLLTGIKVKKFNSEVIIDPLFYAALIDRDTCDINHATSSYNLNLFISLFVVMITIIINTL